MKTKLYPSLIGLVAVLSPSFAAEISLESAPPVVVGTVPAAGATEVDPSLAEIRVTYSKAMQDGSWSWSTWGEENYPETTGKPHYLGDARTCVLPVKLQPNKFYAIRLNSEKFKNFTDIGGRSAVPYLLTFFTGEGGGGGTVSEHEVNKSVSEFPAGEDLSTPEGACVAWQRANARKDAEAVSQLSLVPIDAKEQAEWYRRQEQSDAAGLEVYLKAVADSKIVTVQLWRGELADVVAFLPFPEGKGRSPYSARAFGLVSGEWKNLGEDRFPDLASAKASFERKKEAIWQQYQTLKSKSASGAAASTTELPADGLLNEDQRVVLVWTDRQFRSYFDGRTFEGWSEQERADLEAKSIDALKGPRSQDYYRAIGTLAALHSTQALPALRSIAYERVDRNNRDRWMCIRALGLIGDKADVPSLIQLVYHGNINTRWWAQISLVRLTGQNFGNDWNAWGKWWNDQQGAPPYKPEIVRWWNGQAEPDKLAQTLEESDQKFLQGLK
jgi:HEAT repeats/Bacterial Ig-like domain